MVLIAIDIYNFALSTATRLFSINKNTFRSSITSNLQSMRYECSVLTSSATGCLMRLATPKRFIAVTKKTATFDKVLTNSTAPYLRPKVKNEQQNGLANTC